MNLKMTDLFLDELKAEAKGTRRALEQVPEGHNDWRPHPKSMPLGYLASLVATMPRWIDFMINRDELDFAPVGVNENRPPEMRTAVELVAWFDESVEKALDEFQRDAAINSLFLATFTYGRGIAGRQVRVRVARNQGTTLKG